MDNPFQVITDAFAPEYQINLSIQGLDGSIMLTLSNSRPRGRQTHDQRRTTQ